MEAAVALGIIFLPAILYLSRTPYKQDKSEVLMMIVGCVIGISLLGHLGNFIWPQAGGPAFALAGWIAMLAYAWKQSSSEQGKRALRRSKGDSKNA